MSYSGEISTNLPVTCGGPVSVAGLATLSGGVDVAGTGVVNVAPPTAPGDAANKAYVDAQITAVTASGHPAVRLATTSALPVVAGPATLTATAPGALVVDGVAAAPGDRVLVKDQPPGSERQNGIYVVTDAGSAGAPFVLVRAADAATAAGFTLDHDVTVREGAANNNTAWATVPPLPAVVDGVSGSPVLWARAIIPSQDTFLAETIAVAAAGPALSAAVPVHIGAGGDAGVNVSSALALAGQPPGARHVVAGGATLANGAGDEWHIDFGADNFLDATGTPRRFITLTRGQSATLVSLGGGRWMNAGAGFGVL